MHSASLRAALAGLLCAIAGVSHASVTLPAYNVDTSQTTVSGISSGGYFANQLGVALSATVKGVGIFAGGPYMCGNHNSYTSCMYNASISAGQLSTMQNSIDNWSASGAIDNKSNIAAQKVYMFIGNSDTTVGPNVMNALQTQYQNNGVPAANLDYVRRDGAAHVFPTDFDATGNNACNSATSPYISNCGYDGAKAALTKFYGTLNPRNNAPATANYIEFNQREFTSNPGMAANGWVYVPQNCKDGAQCRVHVALHGCQQYYGNIGDKFIKNSGYSRWADTNSMIVLFPQTQADSTLRSTPANGSLPNPNGCWDWVGWYGANFGQKAGSQIAAVKAMVDRLSSGSGSGGGGGGGGTTLPAPASISASNATTSTMAISWSAVSGAASYNIYRGGNKSNALPVTGASFTDTGLSPATTYSWTVRAQDANGVEGAASAAASGTTTGTASTCYTANNYAHVTAGRATHSLGYAYAKGSGQNMGLYNTYQVRTLKQTGPGYYVIGTCP